MGGEDDKNDEKIVKARKKLMNTHAYTHSHTNTHVCKHIDTQMKANMKNI